MFYLFRSALHPPLSLRACVRDWANISRRLREPPRRRAIQTEKMESLASSLS